MSKGMEKIQQNKILKVGLENLAKLFAFNTKDPTPSLYIYLYPGILRLL